MKVLSPSSCYLSRPVRPRKIARAQNAKTPPDTQSSGVENLFRRRRCLRCEAFEPAVDVTVVHGVVAFDDAGLADGEPPHHQVLDVGLCFLAGREAQGVAGPFA